MLLVQVVKEERGNKGAALTTYLSLAGRYCVLMPNTSHGGGISRKISNGADRKRLKSIMTDLKLPTTMGLIVRTAGLSRTKVEIKRDFDYLARLWDEIRERTLGSTAPALIYRDSDLIKRAIRDLYHREIEEVIVEGEEGYKAARGFMKLLMPSHVRRVKLHSETTPLFQRYGVEDQLSAMYQPIVQLKSGGYLVINPTEALVSIDINSGRSTREHNIEQTAYNTNLEAAQEIARQLRLRDMAGLIVIDFIDMEQNSHVRKVEKAMKEALKNDRARIQVGRISSFGLMEMSRQRLRTGVLEASTKPCPHCEGTGLMRTAASAGLSALRILEDEAARGRGERICLRAGKEAAVYVLNKKRAELADIEQRYGVMIEIAHRRELRRRPDDGRQLGSAAGRRAPRRSAGRRRDDEELEEEDRRRGRGRRGRSRARARPRSAIGGRAPGPPPAPSPPRRPRPRAARAARGEGATDCASEAACARQPRKRPARRPRKQAAEPKSRAKAAPRRRRRGRGGAAGEAAEAAVEPDSSPMVERPIDEEPPIAETEAPKSRAAARSARRRKKAASRGRGGGRRAGAGRSAARGDRRQAAPADEAGPQAAHEEGRRRAEAEAPAAEPVPVPAANNDTADEDDRASRAAGWWQRTFG